jgi:hypothetical protein
MNTHFSRSLMTSAVLVAIVLGLLTSCGGAATTSPSPTATALLKPGDHIGDMIVTNQEPASNSEELGTFCAQVPSATSTPNLDTKACTDVPRGITLRIGPGWFSATQQELESSWSAVQWQIFIDGQELDLASFGTEDSDREEGGRVRAWRVWLENLTPGQHSVRFIEHVTRPIKDSLDDIAVGDYERIRSFTVK